MQFKRLPFWLFFLVIFLTACVPLKSRVHYEPVDYHDLRREDLIAKLNALQTRLENTEKSRRKCSQAYTALERRLEELQEENRRDALRIEALESELAEINFAFEILRSEKQQAGQQE
jgi:septal ring factor EnvC (AmiA/AmiB activator)